MNCQLGLKWNLGSLLLDYCSQGYRFFGEVGLCGRIYLRIHKLILHWRYTFAFQHLDLSTADKAGVGINSHTRCTLTLELHFPMQGTGTSGIIPTYSKRKHSSLLSGNFVLITSGWTSLCNTWTMVALPRWAESTVKPDWCIWMVLG